MDKELNLNGIEQININQNNLETNNISNNNNTNYTNNTNNISNNNNNTNYTNNTNNISNNNNNNTNSINNNYNTINNNNFNISNENHNITPKLNNIMDNPIESSIINKNEEILETKRYIILKENIPINIFIEKAKDFIIIKSITYEVKLYPNDVSLMSKILIKSNDDSFKFFTNIFEQKTAIIEEIEDNMMKLKFSIYDIIKGNKKEINIILMSKKDNNSFIINDLFNRYIKLDKENKLIKEENMKLKSEINKIQNNLENMQIINQNNENKIQQLMNSIENINNFMNNFNKVPNNNNNQMRNSQILDNNNNNNININFQNQINNNPNNNIMLLQNQSNNNNNININETIKIKFPHRCGLENLFQSSYMNSCIQCLSNIEELTNYLIKNYRNFNINNHKLSSTYSNLLYELFLSNKNYIFPSEFKSVIGELDYLFKGNQIADPKDLISFIIGRLHQELKIIQFNQNINPPLNNYQQEILSQDENLSFQYFINDLLNKNKSKIFDIFYGITCITNKCNSCNKTKFFFQTFNIINFDLRKVKENKIYSFSQYNQSNINLYDAFESDMKEEILNSYCNTCKALKNGSNQKKINYFPQVLIIILNRGNNNQYFSENFDFPEMLSFINLPNYRLNNNSYKRFYLSGLISEIKGSNGLNGNYISYFRNSPNHKFICYNDKSVIEVQIEDAMGGRINYNNNSEKIIPYILFYHYF